MKRNYLRGLARFLRFISISTLLLGTFGCAAESSEKAAEAGVDAADARARAIAGGKKGAAIGAVTGGGAGPGVVLATRGKEIHYGAETRLDFTLDKSVQM